jgi:hypothetical protein
MAEHYVSNQQNPARPSSERRQSLGVCALFRHAALLCTSYPLPKNQSPAEKGWRKYKRGKRARPDWKNAPMITQDRQDVAQPTDLQATLFALQDQAIVRQKHAEIDKSVALSRKIFSPWLKSGRLSREEFETGIADLYHQAGLSPPETKDN